MSWTDLDSLRKLTALIADDAAAMSCQTLSQYRSMLLKRASVLLARPTVSRLAKSHSARFLGGPLHNQVRDLAELRSTFSVFEANRRVIYQLHTYDENCLFYVDERVENPVTLIKAHV